MPFASKDSKKPNVPKDFSGVRPSSARRSRATPARIFASGRGLFALFALLGALAPRAETASPDSLVSPLRVAVARPDSVPGACASTLGLSAPATPSAFALALATAISDSLNARGLAAIPDTTLAAWLRRLDATRFPDPGDYKRTREYLKATGAKRLAYVNALRATAPCALAFEVALWNTEPLGRKAARHGESSDPAAASRMLADTLAAWIPPAANLPP